jgi:hypothetical protein
LAALGEGRSPAAAILSPCHRLNEWYFVDFGQERVYIRAEPPGQTPWSQEFAWTDIERIAFQAEGLHTSDGIYIFTAARPESYVRPCGS